MSDNAAFVAELNAATGLNLSLDGEDTVIFAYLGHSVLLRLMAEAKSCLVCADLGRLETAALPQALSDLLAANFLMYDTQGGSLSWSPSSHQVQLNYMIPLDTQEVLTFVSRLNEILSAVEDWAARLEKMNVRAQSEASRRLRQSLGEAEPEAPAAFNPHLALPI